MSFGYIQTVIASISRWVRGSSWYGWKDTGEIFPTPLNLCILVWYLIRDICILEVGFLKWRKSNSWFREGQTSFFTNKFHISFLGVYWGKNTFLCNFLRIKTTYRAWRRKKRRRKRRKVKNSSRMSKFASRFHRWYLSRYVRSFNVGSVHPHTKIVSIEWFLNWLNVISEVLEEHCWIPIGWFVECLMLYWFIIPVCL